MTECKHSWVGITMYRPDFGCIDKGFMCKNCGKEVYGGLVND